MDKFNPDKPYDQWLTAETSDRNGYFDMETWRRTIYDWCVKNNPLNRGIWDQMDEDEQEEIMKDRPIFWPGTSEIHFPQKSTASEFVDIVETVEKSKARLAAMTDRANALWTDDSRPNTPFAERSYRITPDGKKLQANKMKYGPYTGPYDYLGDFKFFGKKKKYLI